MTNHREMSEEEWYRQARRDLAAASHLLDGEYTAHAISLAHLAIEKALKGRVRAHTGRTPSVTHDLTVLAERLDLDLPRDLAETLQDLSGLDVTALYRPDRFFGRRLPDTELDARRYLADARAIVAWLLSE